jgi:predicted DNA-binding antitoxin AbrB/MazE fold protein
MRRSIEAVYEGGVLHPLEPLQLEEGQLVRTDGDAGESIAEDPCDLIGRVYDGLSEGEIRAIEDIILDRRNLFTGRPRT